MKKLQITGLTRCAIRALMVENDLEVIVLASRICGTLIFVAVTVPVIFQVADRKLILPSSSRAFHGIVNAP
jgi:hypothetical protein